MKKIVLLALSLFAVMPQVCAAAPVATPAVLSEVDKRDLGRIEVYLNNLKSVTADFTQISDMGEMRHGKIAIRRPGKMRVAYEPAGSDLIVADGTFVHMWDAEMQQASSVPVGTSLAEFILRESVKLSGDVMVTGVSRRPAKLEVSLVTTKDPGEGELTLVFEDKPLQLRQWRVLDAQGHTTGVNLENVREDVALDGDLFHFVDPNFGRTNGGMTHGRTNISPQSR